MELTNGKSIKLAFRRVFRRKRNDRTTSSRVDEVNNLLNSVGTVFGPRDTLCKECRSLKISELLKDSRTETEPAVPTCVGSKRLSASTLSTHKCSFCRFLWAVFEDKRGRQRSTVNLSLSLFSYPYAFSQRQTELRCSQSSFGGDETIPGTKEVVRRIWVTFEYGDQPSYNTRRYLTRQKNFKLCDIQLIHDIEIKGSTQYQPGMRGRMMGDQVEEDLLKQWIHRCKTQHPGSCLAPRSLFQGNKHVKIRVIDLDREQIIPMPSHCEYVTLSYVWGNVSQLRLTEETYADLTTEGFLSLSHPDLTNSAKDAMFLCRRLGYRYIWIDALCIRQDDREELLRQCENMDLIFQCASLTLVGAAGHDSNAGLPGIRRGSRKVDHRTCDIGGIRIANVCDPTDRALALSKWNSRGWTFQEKILSTRMLIFTDQQVHWVCKGANWCEDTTCEEPPGQRIGYYGVYEKMNDVGQDRSITQLSPFERYELYLEEYSKRDLTYEKDAIIAFAGALGSLHDGAADSHFGHPVPYFARTLAWNASGLTETNHRRAGFPSWCWAGWKGPKSIISKRVLPEYVASFYVIDEVHNPVKIPQEGKPLTDLFGRTAQDTENQYTRINCTQQGKLCFWGSVQRLHARKHADKLSTNRDSAEFNGFTLESPHWPSNTEAPFVPSTWEDFTFYAASIWAENDSSDPNNMSIQTIILARNGLGPYIRVPECGPLIGLEYWLRGSPEWDLVIIE